MVLKLGWFLGVCSCATILLLGLGVALLNWDQLRSRAQVGVWLLSFLLLVVVPFAGCMFGSAMLGKSRRRT
jgi:hypothetical protein